MPSPIAISGRGSSRLPQAVGSRRASVIDLLLVVQIVAATPQTSVTYADVPPEVTCIALFEPRSQGPPQMIDAAADRLAGRLRIRGVRIARWSSLCSAKTAGICWMVHLRGPREM